MKQASKYVELTALVIAISSPELVRAEDGTDPLVLKPSSSWHLDYADDSCRLARQFGEGEQKVLLLIERYQPGDPFFLLAAGTPLDGRANASTAFRFGPGGRDYDGPSSLGDWGGFSPAVMVNWMSLLPLQLEEEGEGRRQRYDPTKQAQATDVFWQTHSADEEARIEWLEIQRGKARPVRLALGSMGPPMAAIRTCTDELLTHWGIDVEAHRGLTRAAAPTVSPAKWIKPGDYPTDLLRHGAQGIVQFRLSIGPDGRPTQCHIQSSTRPAGFDDVVCRKFMKNARFEPALGRDGQPIASYWRSSVRFEIPR